MPGVFVQKGMQLSIPQGALKIVIDENGKPKSEAILHLHYEICPKWVEIMLGHLAKAKDFHDKKIAIWSSKDEDEKWRVLESEMESSVQAIMAAGISIDAFYASIAERAPDLSTLRHIWRKKKTSRPAQIAEVFRRSFPLSQDTFKKLRTNLKTIFQYRDWAVHPDGKLSAAVYLKEIDTGVEPRFAMFRFENAYQLAQGSLDIIWTMTCLENIKSEEIRKYCQYFRPMMAPKIQLWREFSKGIAV